MASSTRAVILTALGVEYRAVRRHLRNISERTHKGTVYEVGSFATDGREPWEVAVVEIGAGNPGAALEAERAIENFKPSVAMFVGVAGGLKDVKKCDVVAATKVYGYESGKQATDFEPRPDLGEASYDMVQRARAEARKPAWKRQLPPSMAKLRSKVFVAPIAAGEKVVAERKSELHRFLRKQYGDAVAVEMEGRGFLKAVLANSGVAGTVVRGISDLVAGKAGADKAGFQRRAAAVASAFAFQLLEGIGSSSLAQESVTLEIASNDVASVLGAISALMQKVGHLDVRVVKGKR